MQRTDVLIVGGGPAGASCAWALRRAGLDVTVLDLAHFPRDKVCAGWITPAVLSALAIDPHEYRREHVLQPINGFRIGLLGGFLNRNAATDIHYPHSVSYGILRREFDEALLVRSDARLYTGEPLTSLRRVKEEWLVNDRILTPMLIGAGGHTCPVARALGAHPGGESVVLAKEIEFLLPESARADCKVRGEQPELYFCHDLAGYGWCFRKGDYLNIGLGREDRWELSKHVEAFIAFLVRERGVPPPPMHLHGHAYLLHGQGKRKLLAHGAMLIGDAAGLAYPHSGEGILPAIESGLLAAQTVIEAAGDYRKRQLAPYIERLRLRYGHGDSLMSGVPAWVRVPLARMLFSSAGLARRVILERGFLHPQQTALSPPPIQAHQPG